MNPESVGLIIPTLNESGTIRDHLQYHDDNFSFDSVTVIDGGSKDGTVEEIHESGLADRCIQLSPGYRARQLSEGVRVTGTDYLLFLHADTYLPDSFQVRRIPETPSEWGWFDCHLDASGWIYETIGFFISLRSALFSSPTGDQAIWVNRDLLQKVGGIPDQPLMEDVELSRRLRNETPGYRIEDPVTTSSRRWEATGPIKTILTMWGLKVGYFAGVAPETLERIYYGDSSD